MTEEGYQVYIRTPIYPVQRVMGRTAVGGEAESTVNTQTSEGIRDPVCLLFAYGHPSNRLRTLGRAPMQAPNVQCQPRERGARDEAPTAPQKRSESDSGPRGRQPERLLP